MKKQTINRKPHSFKADITINEFIKMRDAMPMNNQLADDALEMIGIKRTKVIILQSKINNNE